MVSIDTPSSLESFRRFVISSTCISYAPRAYLEDAEVFAEREDNLGAIYVEAADKVTLKKIRDITFVNGKDVLGIIYNSKSKRGGNRGPRNVLKLSRRLAACQSGACEGEPAGDLSRDMALLGRCSSSHFIFC